MSLLNARIFPVLWSERPSVSFSLLILCSFVRLWTFFHFFFSGTKRSVFFRSISFVFVSILLNIMLGFLEFPNFSEFSFL